MRLIDADAFLEEARNRIDMQDDYLPIHIKYFVIDEMPTIDAEPARHGKWIYQEYKGIKHQNIGYYVCSKCGYVVFGMDKMNRYCSYCGAKMEGEEE